MYKKFTKNETGRDFVIGDVHGMFHLVEDLMEQADFDPSKDRMFVVGDLVDRGPHSKDVASWLMQPWFHAVKGNHEDLAIRGYKCLQLEEDVHTVDDVALHMINGGSWFYEMSGTKQTETIRELLKLPLAIEIPTDEGSVGLVHAEVPSDDWTTFVDALLHPPANFEHFEHYAMWSRDILKNQRHHKFKGVENIDVVIVGHSPMKEAMCVENVLYLDTGAAFGRKLSMVCIQGEMDKIYEAQSDFKWSR